MAPKHKLIPWTNGKTRESYISDIEDIIGEGKITDIEKLYLQKFLVELHNGKDQKGLSKAQYNKKLSAVIKEATEEINEKTEKEKKIKEAITKEKDIKLILKGEKEEIAQNKKKEKKAKFEEQEKKRKEEQEKRRKEEQENEAIIEEARAMVKKIKEESTAGAKTKTAHFDPLHDNFFQVSNKKQKYKLEKKSSADEEMKKFVKQNDGYMNYHYESENDDVKDVKKFPEHEELEEPERAKAEKKGFVNLLMNPKEQKKIHEAKIKVQTEQGNAGVKKKGTKFVMLERKDIEAQYMRPISPMDYSVTNGSHGLDIDGEFDY